MKINEMPPWVTKYKTKGYTIRFQSGKFYLFKVSSVRTKDKPYPKIIQEFIGIITEDNGLIPKKVQVNKIDKESYLEFGLSAFLFINFKRDMKRHIPTDDFVNLIITATITSFIFKDVDDRYLKLTHLPRITGIDNFKNLNPRRMKIVDKLVQRIHDQLDKDIPKQDQIALLFELRNLTLPLNTDIHKDVYTQSLKDQIEKWGYHYGTNYD